MANLTIRNIDDEVVARLKRRAKVNRRSLSAEVREILARAVPRKRNRKDFIALVENIAAMTPKDRPQTDSTRLIRADRRR